jgi:Protein of unknown function (DUF3551)
MRALQLAAATLCVASAMSTCAEAQSYPWCAYFTGGPVDCKFTTLEQCMAAIRGKTALCNQDAPIVPPGDTRPKPAHRAKNALASPAGSEAIGGGHATETPRPNVSSRSPR